MAKVVLFIQKIRPTDARRIDIWNGLPENHILINQYIAVYLLQTILLNNNGS